MADNRREEIAPNIYPLGHPLRNKNRVQTVPTPQPARSRPTILQSAPAETASAAVATPIATVTTPATTDGATTASAATTGITDAQTTEV